MVDWKIWVKLKYLFIVLFCARIAIPLGEKRIYPDVIKIDVIDNQVYKLTLFSGKVVYAPVQFTVIEER